ncbi:putative secreted protein [Halanaeroarchaeum sp. HSR-CO]|uniref:DUF4350 domain-containing protein n=1 Tax=Halanaeroarchaeum sp. HSR-CO TaxID=2866382 RepID=UPI00217CE982|nr:DUF4350 domain-containing protein [Halanaeroarchaeum sp. HSR-CO]UWG46762.1 putative secreted protein [Halanaeroarchaeum sp. HSR-CO]
MRASEIGKRLGVVVVIALLVGAGLSMPLHGGQLTTSDDSFSVPTHQPDAILATEPAETGSIAVDADGESKHVVVDVGHANDIERASLAPMIEALTSSDHSVSFYRGERQATLNDTLRTADAFVVVSPEEPYTAAQRAGLEAFADAGGRVLLAGEPPSQGSALSSLLGMSSMQSSPAPMTGLASSFGFAFGDAYVYNLESYDVNYRNVFATPTDTAAIGTEAGQVTVHEATTVQGGTPLLTTSDSTKLSSTRAADTYPVAARNDSVVTLGDASLLDREWVQRGDNEVFVSAVLEFLVSGDKDPGAPTSPDSPSSSGPSSPTRTP